MFFQWRNGAAVCAMLLAVCTSACSGSQSASQAPSADAQENQALQPLVEKYKSNGLMGVDAKDTTLQVSADAEKWSEQDEESEAALKTRMLDAWVKTWSAHHPHAHAKLTVRFHNYYGEEMAVVSKTA